MPLPPADSDSSDADRDPERRHDQFIRPRFVMNFRPQEELEQPENGTIEGILFGARVEVPIEDDRAVRRIRDATGAHYQDILQVYRACDGNEEQTRTLLEAMG
jgi:hypothetical protein